MVSGLVKIKPTQEPQVKKGEQPGHSVCLDDVLPANSFLPDISP